MIACDSSMTCDAGLYASPSTATVTSRPTRGRSCCRIRSASDRFSVSRTGRARSADDVRVTGGEVGTRFVVELSDQEKIRIQEIADDGTERDELGAVAQTEITAALLPRMPFENWQKPVARRPRQH